jgi:hypothetical protein
LLLLYADDWAQSPVVGLQSVEQFVGFSGPLSQRCPSHMKVVSGCLATLLVLLVLLVLLALLALLALLFV